MMPERRGSSQSGGLGPTIIPASIIPDAGMIVKYSIVRLLIRQ